VALKSAGRVRPRTRSEKASIARKLSCAVHFLAHDLIDCKLNFVLHSFEPMTIDGEERFVRMELHGAAGDFYFETVSASLPRFNAGSRRRTHGVYELLARAVAVPEQG
jgi:hypothetical protein